MAASAMLPVGLLLAGQRPSNLNASGLIVVGHTTTQTGNSIS
jgi:hypothetical protein